MTNTEIINAAATLEDALRITGTIGRDTHITRIEYIKAMRGYRAVGGRFEPTRTNVDTKFRKVWEEENTTK